MIATSFQIKSGIIPVFEDYGLNSTPLARPIQLLSSRGDVQYLVSEKRNGVRYQIPSRKKK